MNEEFQQNDRVITSSKGFAVEVKIAGGVLYRDSTGEFKIDSEWLVKPPGIILYKGSRGNKGFEKIEQSRVDAIFSDVARALEFMGYKAQIWSSPSG
jgi:hypothetical protein